MIPPRKAIMHPILEVLQDGRCLAREMVNMLAVRFGLTAEEKNQTYSSGRLVFDKSVRFALYELKTAGLVEHRDHYYSLAADGREALASGRDAYDVVRLTRRERPVPNPDAVPDASPKKRKKQKPSRKEHDGETAGAGLAGELPMPTMWEIASAVLVMLKDGGAFKAGDLVDKTAVRFALTEGERRRKQKSGGSMFYHRTTWALHYLRRAGLFEYEDRRYRIAEDGRRLLARNPYPGAEMIANLAKKPAPAREAQTSRNGNSGGEPARNVLDAKSVAPVLLSICGNGQAGRISDMKGVVASRLGLTRRERNRKLPSGQSMLYHRTYAAAMSLVRRGLLDNQSGRYVITPLGRRHLAKSGGGKTANAPGAPDRQAAPLSKKRPAARRHGERPPEDKKSKTAKGEIEGRGTLKPPIKARSIQDADRKGIPVVEDRLNEFKEFYMYDAAVERLNDLPKPQQESHRTSIKRDVQKRFADAVCAFGNADGGTIYLGVAADGTIRGLERCRKFGGFGNYPDDFARGIEVKLRSLFPKNRIFVIRNVKIDFLDVGGKTVGKIRVERSRRPLYVGKDQEFFVRGAAPDSQKLVGAELAGYIEEHFRRPAEPYS